MNAVREISLTVWKAVVVTVVIFLGFMVGELLGVPAWSQGMFLLPAALLFYRFNGENRPPIWNLVGFLALLSVLIFLVQLVEPFVPERYSWLLYAVIIALFPFDQIARWCERRFGRDQTESVAGGSSKPELDSEERSE